MTSYAGSLDLWSATVLPLLASGPKPCDQLGLSISTAQRALEGLLRAGLVRPKMHRAGEILIEHWYRTEDLLQRPKHCWELTEDWAVSQAASTKDEDLECACT
jgi:predicted transcriptional regulator